jgi:hypothetical protein
MFDLCRLRRPAVRLNQFGPLLGPPAGQCLSKRAYNMLLLPKYREPRRFSYPGIIHVPVTGRIDARSGRCPCLSYCVYETCERLALCGDCAHLRDSIRDASDVSVVIPLRPCSKATGKGGAARVCRPFQLRGMRLMRGMRLRCARVTARRSPHFPVSQHRPASAALASACQGRAVGGSPPRRARPWMRPRSRAL